MKGYYIEVKNELLDVKHRKKMGSAVWEFMWCLDKITSISEDGVGKVLGGSPVNLEDIRKEIGGATSTISENINKLQKEGYVNIRRIPHGVILTVNKAAKRFGQNSEKPKSLKGEFGKPNVNSEKPKSNIRQDNDKTVINDKTKTSCEQSSQDIVDLINLFKTINPTINFGNKTTRKAASDLMKQFGKEKTLEYATYAISVFGKPYAPTITTPYELREKLSKLAAFHTSEKNKKEKVTITKI